MEFESGITGTELYIAQPDSLLELGYENMINIPVNEARAVLHKALIVLDEYEQAQAERASADMRGL